MRVLVTGASKGIGAAVVRTLTRAGMDVYGLARSGDLLQALARETGCRPLTGDVTDPPALEAVLTEAFPEPPDAVVNSAGVFDVAPLAQTSPEILERNLEVNLTGSFNVVRVLLPGMLKRGSGLVVNVGSVAGRRAFPGNAAYSASKYGLRGMHEVLLEEIRGTGVRASLLEPGACDTPIWDPLDPDARKDLPSREAMLRPEDVAQAVLFLVTRPPTVQIPFLPVERA